MAYGEKVNITDPGKERGFNRFNNKEKLEKTLQIVRRKLEPILEEIEEIIAKKFLKPSKPVQVLRI